MSPKPPRPSPSVAVPATAEDGSACGVLGAYPLLGAAGYRYLQASHIRWAHPRAAIDNLTPPFGHPSPTRRGEGNFYFISFTPLLVGEGPGVRCRRVRWTGVVRQSALLADPAEGIGADQQRGELSLRSPRQGNSASRFVIISLALCRARRFNTPNRKGVL